MQKFNKLWLIVIVPAIVFLLLIAGVWAVSLDQRAKIADEILFGKSKSVFSEQIITAALSARFPNGSDPKELQSFVESFPYGHCEQSPSKKALECTLTLSGTVCVATVLKISSDVAASGEIQRIQVKLEGVSC
ncbi:MAG: hypothetical protein LUQ11_10605 [Methylococcaceae bacterium]|nr:hypothetical protein [Methylococcaceae bacterium]